MHRRILGKDILRLISTRSSGLPVVVAQPEERLAKRTPKVLRAGVVTQTQSAWFTRTNEWNKKILTLVLSYQYEPLAISITESFC